MIEASKGGIFIDGKQVGVITSFTPSFDIDTNVKQPITYAQPRRHGEFFKSGCSVAPAAPKCRNTPWPKPVARAAEQREPLSLYLRRLNRLPSVTGARNAARAMGIPSYTKG